MEQRWHRRRIEPSAAAPVGPVTQSERHAADNHSHPGLSARKVIMILNDASVIIRHRGDLISIHVEGVRAAMAAGNDLVVRDAIGIHATRRRTQLAKILQICISAPLYTYRLRSQTKLLRHGMPPWREEPRSSGIAAPPKNSSTTCSCGIAPRSHVIR